MKLNLNIAKTYFKDKTVDQCFTKLNAIISSGYYNSAYTTYGSLDSTEPLVFWLMTKRVAYSTLPMDIFSTKLFVQLSAAGDKTKIDIKTATNPVIYLFLFFAIAGGLGMSVVDKKYPAIYGVLLTVVMVLAIAGFDRVSKNMLVAGFEMDFAAADKL